jgi:hypothetical protein
LRRRKEMRTLLGIALGVASLAISGVAAAGGWSPPATITNYFTWTHTAAYIRISAVFNPDSCATTEMLYIDTNEANFKTVWSTVLAAHAMGATVSVNLNGCVNGRPQVRAVAVPAIW